jgi:hypothetical protein
MDERGIQKCAAWLSVLGNILPIGHRGGPFCLLHMPLIVVNDHPKGIAQPQFDPGRNGNTGFCAGQVFFSLIEIKIS